MRQDSDGDEVKKKMVQEREEEKENIMKRKK